MDNWYIVASISVTIAVDCNQRLAITATKVTILARIRISTLSTPRTGA